jgi:hypothetical protein
MLFRLIIAGALFIGSCFHAYTQDSQTTGGQLATARLDIQPERVIPIWPGKAPGSEDWAIIERITEGPGGSKVYSNVVNPTLTVYLPDPDKANGERDSDNWTGG